MSEFICKNCGYRKTVGNEMGNMMEIPVYPMYEASVFWLWSICRMGAGRDVLDVASLVSGNGSNGCTNILKEMSVYNELAKILCVTCGFGTIGL